jgi:hypothetical protein
LREKLIAECQPLLLAAAGAFDVRESRGNGFEHRIILKRDMRREIYGVTLLTGSMLVRHFTKKRRRMLNRDIRAVPASSCSAHEASALHTRVRVGAWLASLQRATWQRGKLH